MGREAVYQRHGLGGWRLYSFLVLDYQRVSVTPTEDQPAEFYLLLVQAEPRHFWSNGRNRLITVL